MMARPSGGLLSLRTLTFALILLFAAVSLVTMTMVVWTADVVWASIHTADRARQKLEAAQSFEHDLREFHRLGSLWIATHDESVGQAYVVAGDDLRRSEIDLERLLDRSDERRLVAQLVTEVAIDRVARRSAEASGGPIDDTIRSMTVPFERALRTSAELRRLCEVERNESRLTALQALHRQTTAGFASAGLMVLGLVVVGVGLRKFVLGPLLRLQSGVNRYRPGGPVQQVDGGPIVETRELADRFNQLMALIDRERRNQLTYLAGVAHDLRNPLSALRSMAHLVDEAGTKPDHRARFERQIDRLNRMVSDLLDATRIESGNLELMLETLDLRSAARAMVDLYGPTVGTHELHLHLPEEPLWVRGDPLRLEQVVSNLLSNLLSNAIKYSPTGGRVDVRLAGSDDHVRLEVADEGMGIAEPDIADLFIPFRRRSQTNEKIAGTGLGLSICNRIVAAHGGRISVKSELGVGSVFSVELPRAAAARVEGKTPTASGRGRATA